MGRHLEGLAVALVIGLGLYALIWALGALKRRELRRYERRIAEYFEKRGERLVVARWKPLGAGAQAGPDKLFLVVYVDEQGRRHSASCKSGLSGVFLGDDELIDE